MRVYKPKEKYFFTKDVVVAVWKLFVRLDGDKKGKKKKTCK